MQRLFDFVYLMERTVLDEIALDGAIGATSEPWPVVAQAVRKASFDLMAAYFERAQHDNTSPTITDKLTTLYSRAMMDVVLSTEVQRAERFSFPMALMVFDVDKLADINRRHGYGVGDRVLERLGILIRKFFRQDDWVFRHGEDSIAVLLCQISADDAFFLASRVVAMVEQRLGFKDHNTDDRVRVTVSAATITGQGSLGEPFDAERLLLEADAVAEAGEVAGPQPRRALGDCADVALGAERRALPAVLAGGRAEADRGRQAEDDRARAVAPDPEAGASRTTAAPRCSTSSRARVHSRQLDDLARFFVVGLQLRHDARDRRASWYRRALCLRRCLSAAAA